MQNKEIQSHFIAMRTQISDKNVQSISMLLGTIHL